MPENSDGSSSHEARKTYQRRLFIVETLFKEKTVHTEDELFKLCKSKQLINDKRVLPNDLRKLAEGPFPVIYDEQSEAAFWNPAETPHCFCASTVAAHLTEFKSHKQTLACKVLDLLIEEGDLSSLLLGTGTTVSYFVKELIEQIDNIGTTYPVFLNTNNLLVLCDVIRANKEGKISVILPEGSLLRTSCCIGDDIEGIKSLCSREVDAAIVSFFGIRYNNDENKLSFTSARKTDAFEKRMNLKPKTQCPVYIPIKIDSLGVKGGYEVATHTNLDPDLNRKYTIITNPPANDKQKAALDQLKTGISKLGLEKNVNVVLTDAIEPEISSAKQSKRSRRSIKSNVGPATRTKTLNSKPAGE